MLFGKKSTRIDRVAVAEELANIRVRQFNSADPVSTEIGRKLAKALGDVQREIWIELFLTHYTNKQLRALAEFYRSDVGRSVIETDQSIEKEFQREIRARMARVHRAIQDSEKPHVHESGAIGVLGSSGQVRESNEDADA